MKKMTLVLVAFFVLVSFSVVRADEIVPQNTDQQSIVLSEETATVQTQQEIIPAKQEPVQVQTQEIAKAEEQPKQKEEPKKANIILISEWIWGLRIRALILSMKGKYQNSQDFRVWLILRQA